MSRRDFAQLFKLPISIMSTVSAATGFVVFSHALTWRLVPTASAILLLAFFYKPIITWIPGMMRT